MASPEDIHGRENGFITVTEIESRYIVRYIPLDIIEGIRLGAIHYSDIVQGYLQHPSGERIRRTDDTHAGGVSFHRIRKHPVAIFSNLKGISVQTEQIKDLTVEEFVSLWPQTEGNRREKRRYRIVGEGVNTGLVFELDVFKGGVNEGRTVVEVEFATIEEATSFKSPDWFGNNLIEEEQIKGKPAFELLSMSALLEE